MSREESVEGSMGEEISATNPIHQCVLCERVLDSIEELQLHFRKHANKEISIDGEPIENSTGGEKPADEGMSANSSDRILPSEDELQHHLRQHASREINIKGDLVPQLKDGCSVQIAASGSFSQQCALCKLFFQSKKQLKQHLRCHEKQKLALKTNLPMDGDSLNATEKESPSHHCVICNAVLHSKQQLEAHTKTHVNDKETGDGDPSNSNGNTGHRCVLCNTILDSKEELQLHFRKHADKEIDMKGRPTKKSATATQTTHKCVMCGTGLASKEELKVHFRKHANKEINIKGEPVKKTSGGNSGMKEVKGGENASQECALCKAVLQSKEKLQLHLRKHVNKEINNKGEPCNSGKDSDNGDPIHSCSLCNTVLQSKEDLDIHFRNHTNKEMKEEPATKETSQSNHSCVMCNTVLRSKEELQVHFRMHANKEINIKGEPLEKTTVDVEMKEERLSVPVANTGKVACDVCSKEFANSTSAIQHKFKVHPGVTEKFFCPFCGMQFTIKSLFDNHQNSHMLDTRPKSAIKCELCDVEFYFPEAEEYHNKSTHKRVMRLFQPVQTAPPSKKIKFNNAGEIQSVYYCHLCGSEYVVKFNLQKHLEKAHTSEERSVLPQGLIKCTTCDALFYNQKAYEIHNMSHKPDDLYVTSEQQRLKTVTRIDQDFDITRVLPAADKYLASYKHKPKRTSVAPSKAKDSNSDDDLSPPSTPDPSDSDSDSDVPLAQLARTNLLQQHKGATAESSKET